VNCTSVLVQLHALASGGGFHEVPERGGEEDLAEIFHQAHGKIRRNAAVKEGEKSPFR